MAVFRKRLLFWLIKAYVKKWGKIIFLSFAGGLVIFVILLYFFTHFSDFLPERKEKVGMVGAYSLDTLPPSFLAPFSRGLTRIEKDGSIQPDLASSWEVRDNGKTYVFKLKDNQFFSDGREVTSEEITYEFRDVKIERPDKKTIVFKLNNEYSPFLVTVSRPLFRKGLKGVGDFAITNVEINGNAITSLDATSKQGKTRSLSYIFYPNQDALKTAFLLGEVTKIEGIQSTAFKNTSFDSHKNVDITKNINYNQLVTLFYNTKDSNLSDPNLRRALAYSLPEQFQEGERAYLPYPPTSLFYNSSLSQGVHDIDHAKALLEASIGKDKKLTLTVKTLPKYKNIAKRVADEWKKAGINTKIEEVDEVPQTFQIYLGDFNMPKDPDQYVLWHSSRIGTSNITRFDNKRIDKLLEDGRKTTKQSERQDIYNDFQRFLLEEAPASFLYFPYTYTISRV